MRVRELCVVRRSAALAAVVALSLAACGGDDDAEPADSVPVETVADDASVTMSIADAWSRQPAEGQTATAVYGVVSNPGDADVTIVSASSPVTDDVQLHETIMGDDGQMEMVEREEGFVVPAGGEFVFEPGGPHVMMLDIDPATYPDEVEVTLNFDTADPLTFTAEVRAIDGGMDMDDMDHDDMSSDDSMSGDHMGDMGHDEMSDEDHDHGELDVSALHELDEQLAAGTLDAEAQRSVVAGYIDAIEAMAPADGSVEAELLATLQDLDAALAAGDVETAATLAAEAHETAHGLEHHDEG